VLRPGLLPLLLVLAALAGCGGDDSAAEATTDAAAVSTSARAIECGRVKAPTPKPPGRRAQPRVELDPEQTHELTFETSCGSFSIRLDLESAPNTAISMVGLARDNYFDDTIFHRVVPGFVVQGGDPTATGAGGPGYSTVDPPPEDASYTRGVVAMAKTQTEAPGTAGSQFFVVTGEDIGLPPEYAVLGEVSDGLDVVERIGQLGDPATEMPTQTVVIRDVTLATTE